MKTKGYHFLAWIMVVFFMPVALFSLQDQKTSQNTPSLRKLLENQPGADFNHDGILTEQEAVTWRDRQNSLKPDITFADVAYGEHPFQRLDFWQAKSNVPTPVFVFIHGGGFRGGDKVSIPVNLLQLCLDSGISFVSLNYRLSHHAPYPAPMLDGARAIQFLRFKAEEWNIDPNRIAAGGGSAGSGISQWIGFHDDMADPESEKPLDRLSTRLSCVIPMNMQSTYDPREIKKLIPGEAYKHPALLPFFGRQTDWDWDEDRINPELDTMLKDASPINHLTADDPPVFMTHFEKNNTPGNIHHSNFGKHLKEAMDKLGIECIHHMDSDYPSKTAEYQDMVNFLMKHFGMSY
jgi:acetyl esterase